MEQNKLGSSFFSPIFSTTTSLRERGKIARLLTLSPATKRVKVVYLERLEFGSKPELQHFGRLWLSRRAFLPSFKLVLYIKLIKQWGHNSSPSKPLFSRPLLSQSDSIEVRTNPTEACVRFFACCTKAEAVDSWTVSLSSHWQLQLNGVLSREEIQSMQRPQSYCLGRVEDFPGIEAEVFATAAAPCKLLRWWRLRERKTDPTTMERVCPALRLREQGSVLETAEQGTRGVASALCT